MSTAEQGTRDGTATMVHRANQIALFFAAYTHDEAVAGIAGHLKSFWEPRMRAQLDAFIATGKTDELNPLVIEAVRTL